MCKCMSCYTLLQPVFVTLRRQCQYSFSAQSNLRIIECFFSTVKTSSPTVSHYKLQQHEQISERLLGILFLQIRLQCRNRVINIFLNSTKENRCRRWLNPTSKCSEKFTSCFYQPISVVIFEFTVSKTGHLRTSLHKINIGVSSVISE